MSEQPSFEVSTQTLRSLSQSVGDAAAAVAALRLDPSTLADDLARAGSPPLVSSAEEFGRAWARAGAELEHQTSLLCDTLRRAADSYEVAEGDTVEMLRAARWAGRITGLDGL